MKSMGYGIPLGWHGPCMYPCVGMDPHTTGQTYMTIRELMERLSRYNPDTECVIMTSHDDGDDLRDRAIMDVHDEWFRKTPGDMVSIKCDITDESD